MDSADGYFKRVWYDYAGEDMEIWLEGFEDAWRKVKD